MMRSEVESLLYDYMIDYDCDSAVFDCGRLGVAYVYPAGEGWRVRWLPVLTPLPEEVKERMVDV